jgi:hypothetical protein
MRKDKARDIARGVLPSTARKGARDNKRNYHAKHRHAQRQVNHAIERSLIAVGADNNIYSDPDLFDDFEDLDTFDGYHAATKVPSLGWDDMNDIVSMRRGADKLGPLISWATATEKDKMDGWSVEDKIAYFKAVLPDSLQGRHALGHVQSALDLHNDSFRYSYRYNRPDPPTKEQFRAALARRLSTSKSRLALREFILETVPVAAHTSQTNNKVRTSEPAVNADGSAHYAERSAYVNRMIRTERYRVMVDVYIPQIVAVTCDDCSFLRNDPLATTEAINRFVDLCWAGRSVSPFYRRRNDADPSHAFTHKIFEYVHAAD